MVHVNRLHILKRFKQYLRITPALDATRTRPRSAPSAAALLARAHDDFVHSNAAQEKVFKVFQDQDGKSVSLTLAARRPAQSTREEPEAMHSVVCIKQVPDSSQIRVHPVTNTIMRQGVPAIINPYDLFALEDALRLKDRYGGRVTVLCMGPPQAEAALRKALSFGADEAILVTDRAFAGSDTLATSFALASAIRQIQRDMAVDIVFTGKQTIDGDTAQVGPGIAKRLDLQLLTYVSNIDEVDLERRRNRRAAPRRRRRAGAQDPPAGAGHRARRHQRDALRHAGRHVPCRPLPAESLEQGAGRHRGRGQDRPQGLAHRGGQGVRAAAPGASGPK